MMISGIFLPYALVTKPKNKFPITPPTHKSDATQEASSIVIEPDGNGLSSDVSNRIFGELHPAVTP